MDKEKFKPIASKPYDGDPTGTTVEIILPQDVKDRLRDRLRDGCGDGDSDVVSGEEGDSDEVLRKKHNKIRLEIYEHQKVLKEFRKQRSELHKKIIELNGRHNDTQEVIDNLLNRKERLSKKNKKSQRKPAERKPTESGILTFVRNKLSKKELSSQDAEAFYDDEIFLITQKVNKEGEEIRLLKNLISECRKGLADLNKAITQREKKLKEAQQLKRDDDKQYVAKLESDDGISPQDE